MTKIELMKRLEAFPDNMDIGCKLLKVLYEGTSYRYEIKRVEYNPEDGLNVIMSHG